MKLLQLDDTWIDGQEVQDDELVVVMTRGDLSALGGGMNEAIEAVEDWEFHSRVGVTKDHARALGNQISDLMRESFRPE